MKESEVVDFLREWFTQSGYTVHDFHVKDGNGRPDMVVSNGLGYFTAIEVKRSKASDVFLASKIIDYARDYTCNGAKYIVDGTEKRISNFIVATEYSPFGKLFKDDVAKSEKADRKQAELHDKFPHIEPRKEYQRSFDFVRHLWRIWKDRKGMEKVNVGVLYSDRNDMLESKDTLYQPKMFVMHYTKKGRWSEWWKHL